MSEDVVPAGRIRRPTGAPPPLPRDVGLAHRDIKPANLMVQGGELRLIDVFFVQVRPTPWRQAVDLGNMMLVLALRSDPATVYEAALRYFSPDDLAEAFAATRGVASPTQLRQHLKRDGRDLLTAFRSMAPARRPIPVQRWSLRRVVLIVASFLGLTLAAMTLVGLLFPSRGTVTSPTCGSGPSMQLMAQAVPTATRLPCVSVLPYGWGIGTADTVAGRSVFRVGVGGFDTISVTLTETCPAPVSGTDVYPIEGGCVTYRSSATDHIVPSFAPDGGLSLMPREAVVEAVAADDGQVLCGAGAPPCP